MTISEQDLREYHDGTRGLEVWDEDIARQDTLGQTYNPRVQVGQCKHCGSVLHSPQEFKSQVCDLCFWEKR